MASSIRRCVQKKKSPSPFRAHDDPVTGNAVITFQRDTQDSITLVGVHSSAQHRVTFCLYEASRLGLEASERLSDKRLPRRPLLRRSRGKLVKPIYGYTP